MGSRRRGEDRKKWSFFFSVCLVCGNCPNYGYYRMLSLCLVKSVHSKATPVWNCVHAFVRFCALLSATFNLCVSPACVCVCGPWLTHLCCYRRSKINVMSEWSAGRGIQVGMKERKSGTDRERQSEGAEEKHEVIRGTFTSAGSLTPSFSHSILLFLSFCLSLLLSSLIRSCGLCLFIISLPVAIPTTFSGVTKQKKEGDSLTVAGAVIWVSSHICTRIHFDLCCTIHVGTVSK